MSPRGEQSGGPPEDGSGQHVPETGPGSPVYNLAPKFWSRVSSLPIVQSTVDLYSTSKEKHVLLGRSLGALETGVGMALTSTPVRMIVDKVPGAEKIDSFACTCLTTLEIRVPAIQEPPAEIVKHVQNGANTAIKMAQNGASTAIDTVKTGAHNAMGNVASTASSAVGNVKSGATNAIVGVRSTATSAIVTVRSGTTYVIGNVSGGGADAIGVVRSRATHTVENVTRGASRAVGTVRSGTTYAIGSVTSGTHYVLGSVTQGASHTIGTVTGGASHAIGSVTSGTSNALEGVKSGAATAFLNAKAGATTVVSSGMRKALRTYPGRHAILGLDNIIEWSARLLERLEEDATNTSPTGGEGDFTSAQPPSKADKTTKARWGLELKAVKNLAVTEPVRAWTRLLRLLKHMLANMAGLDLHQTSCSGDFKRRRKLSPKKRVQPADEIHEMKDVLEMSGQDDPKGDSTGDVESSECGSLDLTAALETYQSDEESKIKVNDVPEEEDAAHGDYPTPEPSDQDHDHNSGEQNG